MNPETDLELTRLFDAPPAKVWRCLTEPELLKHWWAPAGVTTRFAEIDLRAGGTFHLIMVIPDHGEEDCDFCLLHVDQGQRLVWTDLMSAGFRPRLPMFGFTAVITIVAEGQGTRYHARAMHQTAEDAARHREMGFHDGWGICADQLGRLAAGI